MKSAKLEWALKNLTEALKLLEEGINMFPEYPKLWMMKGQIEQQKGHLDKAWDTFNMGVSIMLLKGFFRKWIN